MIKVFVVGRPSRSFSGRTVRSLHSSAAGASATRGGFTIRDGPAISPARSISFTSGENGADDRFTAPACRFVARFATNSPVASMLRWLSLRDVLEKPTIGGLSQKALKKLYGARFTTPAGSTVEIQPIGRGATIALNGSCGRPWPLQGS